MLNGKKVLLKESVQTRRGNKFGKVGTIGLVDEQREVRDKHVVRINKEQQFLDQDRALENTQTHW